MIEDGRKDRVGDPVPRNVDPISQAVIRKTPAKALFDVIAQAVLKRND
jgi:hypothetical protein